MSSDREEPKVDPGGAEDSCKKYEGTWWPPNKGKSDGEAFEDLRAARLKKLSLSDSPELSKYHEPLGNE